MISSRKIVRSGTILLPDGSARPALHSLIVTLLARASGTPLILSVVGSRREYPKAQITSSKSAAFGKAWALSVAYGGT
jgi:hypothetical protein